MSTEKGELIGITDMKELFKLGASLPYNDAIRRIALAAQRAMAVEVEALLVSSGIGSIDEQGFVSRNETLHKAWQSICAKLGVTK